MTHGEARLACSRTLEESPDCVERRRLDDHLSFCLPCRAFRARLERSEAVLAAFAGRAPEGLLREIMAGVRRMNQV